tara:strand:- start:1829 stop:2629 length:801 start_codon:yes stop_codon:yes gene_type:complete
LPNIEDLNREFEKCRSHLKSYLLRITTNVQDTEDLVQETYIKSHKNVGSFRGESSLKTWIFTIASNLAKDLMRSKKRWPENVTDICKEAAMNNPDFFQEAMQIRMSSPQGNFEIKEHISFCFTCVSKSLPLEHQLVLLLKEVHGFKVKEIAEICQLTEAMVKYFLRSARGKMLEIYDRRCSLISKNGACHQCTELNGIFNPKQKAEEELRKIEMVKHAENPDKDHLMDLRIKIVEDLDPFGSAAAELQIHHLEHNNEVMNNYLKKK